MPDPVDVIANRRKLIESSIQTAIEKLEMALNECHSMPETNANAALTRRTKFALDVTRGAIKELQKHRPAEPTKMTDDRPTTMISLFVTPRHLERLRKGRTLHEHFETEAQIIDVRLTFAHTFGDARAAVAQLSDQGQTHAVGIPDLEVDEYVEEAIQAQKQRENKAPPLKEGEGLDDREPTDEEMRWALKALRRAFVRGLLSVFPFSLLRPKRKTQNAQGKNP
jgi:hypothetical protein